MASEVYMAGSRIWGRSNKESRDACRSGISKSYEDPMPDYISPELVMLIAQNAPSELDVFKGSLKNWGKVPAGIGSPDWQDQGGWINRAMEVEREYGVQELFLSSGNERNHIDNPRQMMKDVRRSCPEAMAIWSDNDTEDSRSRGAQKVKNVKRKRPKSLDVCKAESRDTGSPVQPHSPKDEQKHDPVGATADEVVSSPKSVDFTSSGVDQKLDVSRPASAPVVSTSRYESDALNAKPWRHGMKKRTSTELKPTETISCKRKAEVDPKKHSEVKKYMETKLVQQKEERQKQKARAEAAVAARKEKQRKLDMECQALLRSQAADVKTKQKTFPRPPWTSEYVTPAETFRPWSSASTGDLPPPKVPRNQEPVPLDLYTSISTYEAAQQSIFGGGCNKSSFSKLATKRRSKKVKTMKAEKQLQGKNMTSDMYEMAFPPTHPYDALHPQAPTPPPQKAPLAIKARWKSKGKSLKRFNPEKIYQLQLPQKYASQRIVDMMAYRRTVRSSRTPRKESQCREQREAPVQKRSESSSQNGFTNILEQDDCYAIAALKEHGRDFCTGSKVKRLKPTSAPAAAHISSTQNDLKPKYSRVRQVKRGHLPFESKELSLQDIAKVMKSRFSPDFRREKAHWTRKSVSPATINSRKCSRNSSLSPRKNFRDEATLQVLKKSTRNELISPRKSLRDEAKAQELQEERHSPTRKELLRPHKQLRDGDAMQILRPRRKDTSNVEAEIDKDVTRAIRRQRMHMLKSLAEQLVKRVDAACAEQQLHNTPQAMSEPTFEPNMDLDNKPFNQQVGLCCTDESLQVELKFYNHSTQPDILYHGNLSELEQAGCEMVELPRAENMSEVVNIDNDLTRYSVTVDTGELNNLPGSETSPHDWNMIDEGMSTDNIPSGCTSYGPSSPSTDSSSPVILPTGAKYHIGRIKRNKNVEEQARKRQKEAWTLPAEEDIHSVITLYTQHWLSKEKKKKNRARCDFSQVRPGEFEENACPRFRSRTPIHEHAPEKHKFKFGSAPLCSELEMSEPYIKSLESDCFTSTKPADSSGVHTELPENDLSEPAAYITQERTVDYINVAETPSPVEKSMATIAVEPMKEENSQKKELAGDPGQRKPAVMLVQIGDLKLCQSPTSFHLRLETQKDDRQLKASTDLVAVTSSEIGKNAADASTAFSGSSEDYQRQVFQAPITPMKITFARRHRTKTMPDGACTDDERIVVEVHQMNVEGGELVMQDGSPEVEKSGGSPSETSRANLRVNLDEVQNWEGGNCDLWVQKERDESKDEPEVLNRTPVLGPKTILTSSDLSAAVSVNSASGKNNYQEVVPERTCSRSQTKGDVNLASLSSLIEKAEEMLDAVPRDAPSTVEETRYSKLEDINLSSKANQGEGRLDRLPIDPSEFLEDSMKTKLASEEAEYHWSKRENQEKKQNDSTSPKAPSTYSRLSTFSSRNRSDYAKSILHEQQSELLSEAESEIQTNLRQKIETTREWQLKSRRDQLEAELQKLDAEIRKTRAKLQITQSAFDAKGRKCDQVASRARSTEKPSAAFAGYTGHSKTVVVSSDDMVSSNLSHPHSASRALSDSPRRKSHACSPELAASAPCRSSDRRLAISIHSDSFVSEDIEMDGNISTSRSLDMVASPVGERYDSKDELLPKQPKFLNKSFKVCGSKSKPNDEHEGPAKEISQEYQLNCRNMNTQDEFVDEGSENSTGRVPWRKFGRETQDEGEEETGPSASPQLKMCSSKLLVHQINTRSFQMLQPTSKGEEKAGILSRVAMKYEALSEAGEDFPNCMENMKVGALPVAAFDRDAISCLDDTTWRVHYMSDDRFDRGSYVAPTHDRGNANQSTSGENKAGSRRSIISLQPMIEEDKMFGAVSQQSTRNFKDASTDAQPYGDDVRNSLQFGISTVQRKTIMTSASQIEVSPRENTTSSRVRKAWFVDCVEDESPSSSNDEAIPSNREASVVDVTTSLPSDHLSLKTSEVGDRVENSPSSSEDGREEKSKIRASAINNKVHSSPLSCGTAQITEEVKSSPLSPRDGNKQKSKSSACVSNTSLPLHQLLHSTPKASSMEEESSPSSRKDGKSRSTVSAGDIGTILQYPLLPRQVARETPLELKEPMASCEKSEVLTVTRDGLIDAVKETLPPKLEVKSSVLTSLQDDDCSTYEDCRMGQLWGICSDVPQNLMAESEEKLKQLQPKTTSSRTSEEDIISVPEAAESVPSLRQDSQTPQVTNTSHPDVHSENSNVLVTRARSERLRHHSREQITFEVRGSECSQQTPRSSNPMVEGMMTDESSEIILSFSDGRNEDSGNPSKLPRFGPSLCQSYSFSRAKLRSHPRLNDSGNIVMTDESGASRDLHQSTESSTAFEKQVVTNFAEQLSCSTLAKETHGRSCAGILDGLQCDLQICEKRGEEHWERLVRLRQENERNRTSGVPTLFPQKAFAPMARMKFSEIGEGPRVLLEARLTDESSTTVVPEVIDDFVTAHGDMFRDSSHVKQICQRSRPLKPSFLMSMDKVGYKELGKMGSDVKDSWKKPLPPILLLKNSRPSETLVGTLTNSGQGESVKAQSLKSKDRQEFHSPGGFGFPTNDKQSPLVADIHNALTAEAVQSSCEDCTSPGFGPEGTGALITKTKEKEKAEMPYTSQGSTPLLNLDLSRSLPRQPLTLFPSLYGNNSEGSDVSEDLENFDSELDEKLENALDTGLTSEELLKSHSPLHDSRWKNPETSYPMGEESLTESECRPRTDLLIENPDIFVQMEGEYGSTMSSSETEVITKSMSLRGILKVEVSSTLPPVSITTLGEAYNGSVSTTSTPPEVDDRDIIGQDTAANSGIEDNYLQDTKHGRTDIACESGTDLASQILENVVHSQQDASAILIALSGTLIKNLDTAVSTFSSSCEHELEQTGSVGDCDHSVDVVRGRSNSRDLKHESDMKVDLRDFADRGHSDMNSPLGSSGALIPTVTSNSFVSSSATTNFGNDDSHETVNNADQNHRGVINYLHHKVGAAEGFQVLRPDSKAHEKPEAPMCPKLSVPRPFSFPSIKPSEDDDRLMREVLNSKMTGSSPSLLGEVSHEDCLNVLTKEVGNLDLHSESSWSEDNGKSDDSQNISNRRADGRFQIDREEVFKIDLEQLEAHGEDHISTTPTTAVEFASQKSEPRTSWLPEEAHQLVECFLSSGSELLDRASQVSKAFSTCSVVDGCPADWTSLECSEHGKEVLKDPSSSFGGLPSKNLSILRALDKADGNIKRKSLTCESEGDKDPECVNPSRPDDIIALRSSNPCHYRSGDTTLDTETALLDSTERIAENLTGQEKNNQFMTPSRPDAQQSSKPVLLCSRDSLSDIQHAPISLECIARGDVQDDLGIKQSCYVQEKLSRGTELLEFREFMNSVTSSVPQLASALAISLQIPEVGESRIGIGSLHDSDSNFYDDKLNRCREYTTVEVAREDHIVEDPQLDVVELNDKCIVYREDSCISGQAEFINLETSQGAEIQYNKEQKHCRLPTEDTSTLTGHDQDSICSLAGSGGSQDLDGTLEDVKLQTAANMAGKHNMMTDTLTDMLFETLLEEGLSELACPSRFISRASSREANQTLTVSKTPKSKNKSRSKRGFVALLKHFLPTGWRAVSVKHKAGLFLQVEGLRPHPLSSALRKSISNSKIEGLTGAPHNGYPSPDDFEHCSLVHRATSETAIPLLTSEDYVQSFVQKSLELSNLINDPSPSNWYDSKVPVGQEIYRRVMETQRSSRFGTLKQSDWQVYNKLLSDLVNESLVKYSFTAQQSRSTLLCPVDGGNLVHFVTSRIVEHGRSALKNGPDIDKVVGKLLEDEQWEKCHEEAKDLVSDLAQGILCDLIDRFVREMIKGKNNTSGSISII